MATITDPVVTRSSLSSYEPYRKAINEIVYRKGQWEKGQQTGNKGLQTWASTSAQQFYSQLPTELANQLRGMNYQQAREFLSNLGSSAGGTYGDRINDVLSRMEGAINQPATNPYDQQISDLLGQITQAVNQPITSPYDTQIADLLNQIAYRINNPTNVDPRTTPEFAAAQAAIERQAQQGIRAAQEALGASGFARSTNLAERAQNIANAATEYLETQVVPQIAAQIQARDQQGLENSLALVQALAQQQGVFTERQQQQLQNLGALLGALTGQQQTFDLRQQRQVENLGRLLDALSGQQTFELQRRAQEFAEQQALIQNELARIDAALERANTLGYVSQSDAALLGVPAGTPTFQAREAAAQRQHQLRMLEREIAAQNARLQQQLAFEREQRNLDREASSQSARISDLLRIWESTNSAPPGLEAFGIRPGQPFTPYLSPSQQLDQLQLNQQLQAQREQERISQMAPVYQSRYNLDSTTAQALVSALDNPTYEAAIADLNAHESTLRQMGVDVKALRKAIQAEMNPSTQDIERAWNQLPASERSRIPKVDWFSWYRSPTGRRAGIDFWTWHAQYGPRLTGG